MVIVYIFATVGALSVLFLSAICAYILLIRNWDIRQFRKEVVKERLRRELGHELKASSYWFSESYEAQSAIEAMAKTVEETGKFDPRVARERWEKGNFRGQDQDSKS